MLANSNGYKATPLAKVESDNDTNVRLVEAGFVRCVQHVISASGSRSKGRQNARNARLALWLLDKAS